MNSIPESNFLVDAESDPVAIRVEGKASFKNCACVKTFLDQMIAQGKIRFVMDFAACSGMDSTFLGVLAGAAITLRKLQPRGTLVVARLNERNLELVQNLGLTRLLTVDDGAECTPRMDSALDSRPVTDEIAAARVVLTAHQNLVKADAKNEAKFKDVLAFLQQQISQQ
jgi:anti-sigma B factor antagonist